MHPEPYVPDLRVGSLFRRCWPVFKDHLGLIVGTFLLYTLLTSLGGGYGVGSGNSSGLLGLVSFVISGPLAAGTYWLYLKLLRGEPAEFRDMFAGFQEFGRAFGVFTLGVIATIVGFVFFIIPGIIVMVGLWPGLFLVLDDGLGVMDTLKEAWAMTRGYRWQLFVLGVALFLLLLAGLMVFVVGAVFTGAFGTLVAAAAYDELALASE